MNMNDFLDVAKTLSLPSIGDRQQLEEVKDHFEQALEVYRQLAEVRPDVHLPHVAGMLNGLGIVLWKLRQLEGAKVLQEEALEIYRQLTRVNPDAHMSNVAETLNELGAVLVNLRQPERAKGDIDESLRIYRQLTEVNPESYLPNLAEALHNRGNVLMNLHQFADAKEQYEEVLGIYRQLAEAHPDVYLPNVAGILTNLGTILVEFRQLEGAKVCLEAALGIYRQFAEKYPENHLPGLAATLTNLGTVLRDLWRSHGAKVMNEDALGIYRQLAEARPNAYLPYMAITLSRLATALRDLGQFEGAKVMNEEALGIYRQLAEAHPDIHFPDVALALNNLGAVLVDLHQDEAARACLDEALGIYRQLAEIHPNVFLPSVPGSLHNLGNALRHLGDLESARKCYEEAIALCDSLPLSDLDRVGHLYSLALLEEESLGNGTESAVRLYEQAVQSCEEGLSRLGEAEWQHRDIFKGEIENAYLALIEHNARQQGEEPFRKLFGLMESLRNVESLANFGVPERSPLRIAAAPTQEMRRLEAQREAALARGEDLTEINAEIQSLGRESAREQRNRLEEVLEGAQGILKAHNCAFLAVQATQDGEMVFLSITPEGHRVDVADHGFLDELDGLFEEVETGIHQLVGETRAPAAVVRNLWRSAQRVPRKGKSAFSKLPSAVQELLKDPRYQTLFLAPDGRTVNHPFELLESSDGPIGLKRLMSRVHGFSALVDVLNRQPLDAKENRTALVVGDPRHEGAPELPGARAAASFVARRLREQRYSLLPHDELLLEDAATAKAFLTAFERKPGFTLYDGHGGRDAGGEYLALAGKDKVRPHQIVGFDLSHHPAIHYDCCVAGASRYLRGGRFDGHPSAAMLAGASCCLASVHPIFDEPSCAFTCRLYDKLLNAENPATFGAALLKTRQEMEAEYSGNPLVWGLTMFWGNPFVRLI